MRATSRPSTEEKIAGRFLAQWREFVKEVDSYPDSLTEFDTKPVSDRLGSGSVTAWFAPNPRIGSAPTWVSFLRNSGREGIRTPGLLIANSGENKLRQGATIT
jgi:hypothetical protein